MSIGPDEVIARSVDNVQNIYAVIIAVAITDAIETLLKNPDSRGDLGLVHLRVGLWPFIAFLFTVVPFWQGMNRHLDRCYLEKKSGVNHPILLGEVGVFFLEAIILFGAGLSIKSGINTFYWLGVLLFVDTVWAIASHLIHFPRTKSHAQQWAIINVGAIMSAGFVILLFCEYRQVALTVVAVGRTIVDYNFGMDFYFPKTSGAHG